MFGELIGMFGMVVLIRLVCLCSLRMLVVGMWFLMNLLLIILV